MGRLPDRKRLEYLRKQAIARGLLLLGNAMYGPLVCLTLFLGIGVFGGVLVGIVRFLRWRDTGLLLFSLFPGLGATLLAALFTRCCQRIIERAEKAARMPYIPPVPPSDLPAEEVLVRGRVEPDSTQETLLRAAQSDEKSKPEELLRVGLGTTGEQD